MNMSMHVTLKPELLTQIRANPQVSARSSTLPVFGWNLRKLTAMRGTQSAIATDLGISRIQFRRYLRGESFPKPNLLKQICDYFDVDARILTEPLTDRLFQNMKLERVSPDETPALRDWKIALSYASQDHDFFHEHKPLAPGLYVAWCWSAVKANTVTRLRMQVFERQGVSLLRGYHESEGCSLNSNANRRQFRGICLTMSQGHSMLIFPSSRCDVIATWYVSPNYLPGFTSDVLVGYAAICRNELPGLPRLSRLVIERIPGTAKSLLNEAHAKSSLPVEIAPEGIRTLLCAPIG